MNIDRVVEASMELQQSVRYVLADISSEDDSSLSTTISSIDRRKPSNTYEWKRSIRNIHHCLISYQEYIAHANEELQDHHSNRNQTQLHGIVVDNNTLETLIDILTELPKLGIIQELHFDDLFQSLSGVACDIIENFASMPLGPSHLDRLIDRIGSLALESKIDFDILQLVNATVAHKNASRENNFEEDDFEKEGSEDPSPTFLLDFYETVKVVQILITLSLTHLGQPWAFLQRGDHDDSNQINMDNSSASWHEQHGGLQLRVLLSYLLSHLVQQAHVIVNEELGSNATYSYEYLKRIIVHVFEENDNMDNVISMHMAEDYLDLVTSFFVENIRFVIDAITDSSESLTEASYEDGTSRVSNIYRQVRDVTRLTSLTIDMISCAWSELELPRKMFSFEVKKLHDSFALFVGEHCTEKILAQMRNGRYLLVSAESVIFRFWKLVHIDGCPDNISNFGHLQFEENSAQLNRASQVKRRRLRDDGSVDELELMNSVLGTTALITMFRAIVAASDGNDDAIELLETKSLKDKMIIQNLAKKNRFSNELQTYYSVIQAVALSSMILPENNRCCEGDEDYTGFNRCLSNLLEPFVSISNTNNDDPDNENRSSALDISTPWNYYLSRHISSKMNCIHENSEIQEQDTFDENLSKNSESSISDMKACTTPSIRRNFEVEWKSRDESDRHDSILNAFCEDGELWGTVNTLWME